MFEDLVPKFQNETIKEYLATITQVSGRDSLGVARWDNVLDQYKYSGTVKIPIKLGNRVFPNPFYFVIEKVQTQELLTIRPVKGEPYRLGDVFGFFGISHFNEYSGEPILLVEGVSDWAACKVFYPWTLATLTSGVSRKQLFFLSSITKRVYAGFDTDKAGNRAALVTDKKLAIYGMECRRIVPPQKDWGVLVESSWGRALLEVAMGNLKWV